MKQVKYIIIGIISLILTSCNDFLTTTPKDALIPGATWKTEEDAHKFLIGCYDGWESGTRILYLDCASDFAYNNFSWEGYKMLGNGTLSSSNPGAGYYSFDIIGRCNTLFNNIDNVSFSDERVKHDIIAQARVIQAYRYFVMNWWYGGVPIISTYSSAEEAKVPRNTEAEVREFVENELDTYTKDLSLAPQKLGYIAQGAALAIRMRQALYYEDWNTAKNRAQQIIDLNQYELDPSYENLFRNTNKESKEIILAVQYIPVTKTLGVIGQMYNNSANGWSSIVPTQNLVDTYEMSTGKTILEPNSGYDPVHPYANRDPRLEMSIYYPGAEFITDKGVTTVFNTLNPQILNDNKLETNPDYRLAQDNSSKTGMTWAKYLNPITQYSSTSIWETDASPIVFRYAEVLLTFAEAENELNGPSNAVYSKLNAIRNRVGMPDVDQAKYNTKESVRELIQRERAVEFAGEGLRRADLVRWKTKDGKMLAEKVLNGSLETVVGTINTDLSIDPTLRATIKIDATEREKKIEDRVFKPYNRYLPIPQEDLDSNPKLEQNEGYK